MNVFFNNKIGLKTSKVCYIEMFNVIAFCEKFYPILQKLQLKLVVMDVRLTKQTVYNSSIHIVWNKAMLSNFLIFTISTSSQFILALKS